MSAPVLLLDDERARTFQPFALTRPAGEMRAGALLVRERWTRALGAPVAGHLTAPHLAGFEEPGAAPVLTGGTVPAGAWVANARFAPALAEAPRGDVLVNDGRVAAVRLAAPIDASVLRDGGVALEALVKGRPEQAVAGWWMHRVWDYVAHLVAMLTADLPSLGIPAAAGLPAGTFRVGSHPLFIEPGAEVEPSVCFDLSAGPICLRAGSHVQAFTRLVGPLYVGAGSTVTTDRIASSSIGDICKVHGEVSNTIFLGHANKGHDGFVGHSILGRWVNLGAGTITSNLKNTYGTVQLWTPEGLQDTGMQFLGTMFGDHAKTGIGLTLTTGTVLGTGANVFNGMPPKAVSPFAWGEPGAFTEFRADKFLEVAERMMARRHVTLGEQGRRQLRASYDNRWSADS